MSKFHINPKTGNPGACKAQYVCPFGDMESEHYDSAEAARVAYEVQQGNAFAVTVAPAIVKALRDVKAQPWQGGHRGSMSASAVTSATHEEWTEAAATFRAEVEEKRPAYTAWLAAKAPSTDESEAMRAAYATAITRQHFAEEAAKLTAPRTHEGKPVPAGFAEAPAVFDLDGNFVGAAKDTYFGPQRFKRGDGSELVYRQSKAKDPVTRRNNEAANGYYTGTALVPMGVEHSVKSGVQLKPAYTLLRKRPDLAIPVDKG